MYITHEREDISKKNMSTPCFVIINILFRPCNLSHGPGYIIGEDLMLLINTVSYYLSIPSWKGKNELWFIYKMLHWRSQLIIQQVIL